MSDLLYWAAAKARCSDVERELQKRGETLGPMARHAPAQTIGTLVRDGHLLRFNSALGCIEDMVAAFEYAGGARTKTTPREACGPELKALLTAREFSMVNLRTLPAHEEDWWRIEAPSMSVLHGWLKQILFAGCFYRSLLCEGANGWISFAGEMAHAYGTLAKELSQSLNMEVKRDQAPKHQSATTFKRVLWSEASAQIYLCDPWQVLKGAA